VPIKKGRKTMNGQIKSFRDLIVWQKSMVLVTEIYNQSMSYPKEELYGLTSQIRRSAVSVPSNIAEGYGRKSTGDYTRFLQISVGSLYELDTQLEIAKNLEYLPHEQFCNLSANCNEISKMLNALIKSLSNA
jgi:four helix bundle protein